MSYKDLDYIKLTIVGVVLILALLILKWWTQPFITINKTEVSTPLSYEETFMKAAKETCGMNGVDQFSIQNAGGRMEPVFSCKK